MIPDNGFPASRKCKLSSILKALKRVEAESPPPQSYQSLPGPIDSKQALNSKTKKHWRLRKLCLLFLILLTIGAATAALFSQRQLLIAHISSLFALDSPNGGVSKTNQPAAYRAKVPPPPSQAATKPPTTARQPNLQVNRPAPANRNKRFQATTQPGNRQSASRPATSRRASIDAGKPAESRRLGENITPQQKPLSPPAGSLKRAAAKRDVRSTAPAVQTQKPARPASRATYKRFEDDKLRLQALAWADDADRRMAVINGRIVHEGESVEGYQILKIREEDVIVNQGGTSWRLEFGLQQ